MIRVNLNHQAKTDQAGRWSCNEAPDRLKIVSVSITHPDYVLEGRRSNFSPFIRSARELSDLRVQNYVTVLKQGVSIRGLVRDNEGKPIEGAQVFVASSPIQRSAATDAAGRFELAHQEEGENQLVIRARGYAQASEQVVASHEMAPVEIRLQAGRTISGTVVDRRKKPIPGAQVSFDPGDFNQDNLAQSWTTSDGTGHFQLDIADDPGSLVARHDMYQATRLVRPSDRDVTIEVRTRPVIVRGEVTDSESGQPVPSFVVITQGVMQGRTPSTAGRYEIEWTNSTLPLPGSLWVGIEAKGYATSELRAVPSPGDRDEVVLNFRLKKAAPIVGVIRGTRWRTARRCGNRPQSHVESSLPIAISHRPGAPRTEHQRVHSDENGCNRALTRCRRQKVRS